MEFRTLDAAEFDAFFNALDDVFLHERLDGEQLALWRAVFEPDRALCAFDAGDLVATSVVYSLRLGVPGDVLPMAGVSGITTQSTHRRRGLLTRIMRAQLEAARVRGEPLSALFASESSIYGRFGYGPATTQADFEIDRRHTRLRDVPREGRVRVVDGPGFVKAVPGVLERHVRTQPGAWEGNPAWNALFLFDPPNERDGALPYRYVVHEDASGQVDGYACYRLKHGWEEGFPNGSLDVEELVALTPAAEAGLWDFLFGIDLVATIKGWSRPPVDPLRLMLVEPRRMRQRTADGLWLRLLDVPAALAARRYRVSDRLVLDVRDEIFSENDTSFRLDAGPSGAHATTTEAPADLSLDVAALSAAYLGGTSFHTLAWAGRVSEHSTGALARADALFAWDPAPWTMAHF